MEVDFCGRNVALSLIQSGVFANERRNFDLISINDSSDEINEMTTLWRHNSHEDSAGLFMKFLDLEDERSGFTEYQAHQIVDFVKFAAERNRNLIVHCYVGSSRSPAIARWIAKYLGVDNPEIIEYNLYNKYVFDLLEECKDHSYGDHAHVYDEENRKVVPRPLAYN